MTNIEKEMAEWDDIDPWTQIVHKECDLPIEMCACENKAVKIMYKESFIIDIREAYLRQIP